MSTVSCGVHDAANCSACPQGNGESWCNGDCLWIADECVERTRIRRLETPIAGPNEVSCGYHNATKCADCPQDHGSDWCHGDCAWFDDECIDRSSLTVEEVDSTNSADVPSR